MRKEQYFKRAIAMALASAMIAGGTLSNVATPVQAATQKSIVVSNNREVLVAGRTYNVKNENATNFKSSNEDVATVTKAGKITPLKTGYVTISAKVEGKTVKTKFLCVSKYGKTDSQTKVDKMLDASNVKNISIVTTKDVDYTIAEGDYTNKTLTVKAPNADVDNHGTFKKIKVKDVAENTFRNFSPNKFVITDKNFRFADKSNGSSIEVAEGAVGRVVIQGKNAKIKTKGNVEVKPHGKKASISKVEVEGGKLNLNLKSLINAIAEVLIQKAAVVDITGGKDAKLNVVVGKDAKGATINSDSTVNLVVNAEIVINLTGNAGGSKIDVADGVKVEVIVASDVKGSVTVGDTEVKAGDKVAVSEDGKVEVNNEPVKDDTTTGDNTGNTGSTGNDTYYPPVTPPADDSGNKDDGEIQQSSEKGIKSISFIDAEKKTVNPKEIKKVAGEEGIILTATVEAGTDIKKLIPKFELEDKKATIKRADGKNVEIETDFSGYVEYVVTAENGTIQEYFVEVVAENLKVDDPVETTPAAITFITNGGTSLDKQIVANGEVTKEPVQPTKKGHTFKGWYRDSEFANQYVFGEVLTEDIILYAKWEKETYTVTFMSDGEEVTTETVEYDATVAEPDAPIKDGHIFDGWYLNGELYDFNTPVEGDITLVAKWTKDTSGSEEVPVTPAAITIDNVIWKGTSSSSIDVTGSAIVGEVNKENEITVTITSEAGITLKELEFDIKVMEENSNLSYFLVNTGKVEMTKLKEIIVNIAETREFEIEAIGKDESNLGVFTVKVEVKEEN